MIKFDSADMLGGLLMLAVGAAVTFASVSLYPLGTIQRMGPGMFPAGLGAILAFLGVILAVRSIGVSGKRLDIRIVSPIFVLLGIASFAFTIELFGLIPAIISIVVISSIAELKVNLVSLIVLCAILCALASLVFVIFLGLALPLVRWPF